MGAARQSGAQRGETLFIGRAPAALHTEKVISSVAAEEGEKQDPCWYLTWYLCVSDHYDFRNSQFIPSNILGVF